jgi:hypothetical protein
MSLTAFRTAARKRGSNGWNANVYAIHRSVFWLFAVEYANFNWQETFNAALTDEGFHQGGLGDGVTTWDSNCNTFNGYNPFVPCGHTNSLGNNSGVVNYTVKKSDDSDWKSFNVPSYRGIENPFGHVWKWTDGVLCNIQSNTDGGVSEVYSAEYDVDNYASSLNAEHKIFGSLPRSEGYMKEMQGITKNLSAINASYEMQVKSISAQTEIVESVNSNLNKIGSAMEAASAQTEQFKEQATKLTQQVSSLNNVYGNMLNAFGARI